MKININGEEVEIKQKSISYDKLVDLIYGDKRYGSNPSTTYFCRKPHRQGMLCKGDRIHLCEGMSITCISTDNA